MQGRDVSDLHGKDKQCHLLPRVSGAMGVAQRGHLTLRGQRQMGGGGEEAQLPKTAASFCSTAGYGA